MEHTSNRSAYETNCSLIFKIIRKSLSFPAHQRSSRFVHVCFSEYWGSHRESHKDNYLETLFPFPQMKQMLHDSFLSSSLAASISTLLDQLEKTTVDLYGSSQDSTQNLIPKIESVLNAYYRLFRSLLEHWSSLQQGLDYVNFLRTALNLGCSFLDSAEDGNVVGFVTPFAPGYLSAILEISDLLSNLTAGSVNGTDADQNIFKAKLEILNSLLNRYLRRFLLSPSGELCHAALRTSTSLERENSDICAVIRPISSYSSFDSISELRLFEKIKYELEHNETTASQPKFRILIAGDLDTERLSKFGKMLGGWLKNKNRRASQFQFNLFTKTTTTLRQYKEQPEKYPFFYDNHLNGAVHSYTDLFQNPGSLKEQIGNADLLFFLDCFELYNRFQTTPYTSLNALLQQTAGQDYSAMRTRTHASGTALLSDNPYFLMQNLLLGAAYSRGAPALLKKEINSTMLQFMKEQLSPKAQTAYVYFSDLDAAQDLYWNEDRFMRLEQYAGKRIAILRFGEDRDDVLEPASSAEMKTVVFTLWQFIKHTNLRRVDTLMNYFRLHNYNGQESDQNLYLLSKVLIGVDYRDWPVRLRLTYSYSKDFNRQFDQFDEFEAQLEKYLKQIVLPCFTKNRNDIYDQYFRTCISSFLYSDSKNIDDMLFLHLYSRQFDRLGCQVSLEKAENLDLENLRPHNLKYSGKRFYQTVMDDYDEPSQYFANQYRKLELMQQTGGLSPAKVFQNIRSACEQNHYQQSHLYRNCSEMLQSNFFPE